MLGVFDLAKILFYTLFYCNNLIVDVALARRNSLRQATTIIVILLPAEISGRLERSIAVASERASERVRE